MSLSGYSRVLIDDARNQPKSPQNQSAQGKAYIEVEIEARPWAHWRSALLY